MPLFLSHRRLVPLLFLALAVAATSGHAANLLAAPGSAWTQQWTAGYGCVRDAGLTDHEVLKQTLPATFSSGNYSWYKTLPVSPGARYHFSVRYQLRDVKQAVAQFHFAYPDGTLMDFLNFRETSPKLAGTETGWKELSYDFGVPAGAAAVRIALRLNSPGTIFWDSPSLDMAAPTPAVTFDQDAHDYDLQDSVAMVVREIPLDKIAPLHIRWLRYNINWAAVQPDGPDTWNEAIFAHAIQEIAAARKAGYHVMISIGYSPRWAARTSEGVNAGDLVARDQRDWRRFVEETVRRLGDLGDCYRIMNEVDHMWDTGSQPQEYTVFLKTAYAAIKAVRPSATVVMAGLSGTPGGYLGSILDAGGGTSFDIAACQPYIQGRHAPEEGRLTERLQAYRMVLAAHGQLQPIWATEFGYPSEPLDRITPMEQAGLCVRSHLLALSSRAGVTKFFFYLLHDEDGDTTSQTGGMYTKDWQLKPMGKAVAALADAINPARRYLGTIDLGKDPAVYNRLFERADGQCTWALWRTQGASDVTLEFAEPVRQFAWDGTTQEPAKSFRVTLGNLPVYFVGKMPDITARVRKPEPIGFNLAGAKTGDALAVPWETGAPDWGKAAEVNLTARRNPQVGVVGKARLLATPGGLSVQVNVDDTSPASNTIKGYQGLWTQDSVELYVNLAPEQAPAGFTTNDCYHFIATPGVQGEGARLYWASRGSKSMQQVLAGSQIQVTVRPDGSGYAMSFVLPWSGWASPTPKPGDMLGFDVLVTRSDAEGRRDETAAWFGNVEDNADASLWGSIRLGTPARP